MRSLFLCLFMLFLSATITIAKPTRKNIRSIDHANQRVVKLAQSGKFKKALPLARRTLKRAERLLGGKHPSTVLVMNSLAFLHHALGDYEKAVDMYNKILKIYTKELGKEHINTLASAATIGDLYRILGRYKTAEPILRNTRKALTKKLGANHQDTLDATFKLATLLSAQGKYPEAEELYLKTLAARKKALGEQHPDTITTINDIAPLYTAMGEPLKAEKYYLKAFQDYERYLGKDHPDTLSSANNLAAHYENHGRYADAEALYLRALKESRRVLGDNHLDTITTASNLAGLYKTLKRFEDSEKLYQKALRVHKKKLGEKHPSTIISLNNLADLYMAQKLFKRAEPLLSRALDLSIEVLGDSHPDTIISIRSLGKLYFAQQRYEEAKPLFIRAYHLSREKLGRGHPYTLKSINSLAHLYRAHENWEEAVRLYEKGTAGLIHHTRLSGGQTLSNNKTTQAQRDSHIFQAFLKSSFRLSIKDPTKRKHLTAESFNRIQWTKVSGASNALSQMAVRFGARNSQLAVSVRKRQDLVREWKVQDKLLTQAFSKSRNRRNHNREKSIKKLLTKIQSQINDIDELFKRKYPNFSSLTKPEPLTIENVQSQLRSDEALVYFIDTPRLDNTPEETFIWVITKVDVAWARSKAGNQELNKKVKTLRCGLDISNWATSQGSEACNKILKTNASYKQDDGFDSLPFDRELAHELYQDLFSEVEHLISDKKLLLVPSGPLTSLPFQVLITKKASPKTGFANISWLITRHDLTILPSVSSLKALRRTTNPSRAKKPFLGIGNPLLTGPDGTDDSAFLKQLCNFTSSISQGAEQPRQVSESLGNLIKNGKVDLEKLRRQVPLPETADELCAVANVLGGDAASIHLGAKATERNIKKLSKRGFLKNARVVHFATHGLLADETKLFAENKIEPSLLLTPPKEATDLDDGLLTASEISQLNLDADWVILSACNTAAGDKPGAEAMSGLAKAFFYAGARALLVSHWAVDSQATVKLITTSLQAQKKDPSIGRAGALRVAMEKLLKTETYSHPAYWAPFIVVGEGSFILKRT